MGRRLGDDADRPHVSRTGRALTADFDPDLAPDNIELPDIDANAVYARVLQYERRHLFRERLDKIDMASADDELDRVDDKVVGKDRAHVVRLRAGTPHQRLDFEHDTLMDAALEIICADLRGDDEVAHEHAVEFTLVVASANDAASEQSPIDLRRSVQLEAFTGDQI